MIQSFLIEWTFFFKVLGLILFSIEIQLVAPPFTLSFCLKKASNFLQELDPDYLSGILAFLPRQKSLYLKRNIFNPLKFVSSPILENLTRYLLINPSFIAFPIHLYCLFLR